MFSVGSLMFLTDGDLQELTGFVRPSKQIEWLTEQGIVFRVSSDGHPRVLVDHLRKVMGASVPSKQKTAPDFSTLRV